MAGEVHVFPVLNICQACSGAAVHLSVHVQAGETASD